MPKTPVPYRRKTVDKLCHLIEESDKSLTGILKDNPDLPTARTLLTWRDQYPVFNRMWKRAKEIQAEYLNQKLFDMAREATPKNAHQIRVQFDIYKWLMSKANPTLYGDKPDSTHLSIQTAVVVSPERLDAIRANLERSRARFKELHNHRSNRKEKEALYPETLKALDQLRHPNARIRHNGDKNQIEPETPSVPEP